MGGEEGDFAGLGFADGAAGLQEVAEVEEFELVWAEVVGVCLKIGGFDEELDFAREVFENNEGEFAEAADGADTAGD